MFSLWKMLTPFFVVSAAAIAVGTAAADQQQPSCEPPGVGICIGLEPISPSTSVAAGTKVDITVNVNSASRIEHCSILAYTPDVVIIDNKAFRLNGEKANRFKIKVRVPLGSSTVDVAASCPEVGWPYGYAILPTITLTGT
jgi:hypothetical protein